MNTQNHNAVPTQEEDLPLLLTIDDVCAVLRIGRNATYELLHSGRLKSVRIGKQYRVPRHVMIQFLAEVA